MDNTCDEGDYEQYGIWMNDDIDNNNNNNDKFWVRDIAHGTKVYTNKMVLLPTRLLSNP